MNIKHNLRHPRTTRLNSGICCAVMVVVAMQMSTTTLAENVKMYSSVPSANEMASHLFPSTPPERERSTTRSISRSISFDSVEGATASIPPVVESIGLGLPIQFNYNSDEITEASRPYIDELGKMLSRDDLRSEKIVIEGHTDASGDSQYNQELSLRRAEAIKLYLFYKFDIDRNRLVVSGKGEYVPLGGKDPFSAVNRRVEIYKFQ